MYSLEDFKTEAIRNFNFIPGVDGVNSLEHIDPKAKLDKAQATNAELAATTKKIEKIGQTASFLDYKLTTSGGKNFETSNHVHIFCLLYTFLTTAKETGNLSLGFQRHCDRS